METQTVERGEKSGLVVGAKEEENKESQWGKLIKLPLYNKVPPPSTPPPSWKFFFTEEVNNTNPTVSVRKLGASLWEVVEMNRGVGKGRFDKKENVVEIRVPAVLDDPSHSPHQHYQQQPDSAGSLRRHVAASLMQHQKSIRRKGRALPPISPTSYVSSMEVATYNQPITPASSLDIKGRHGESSYTLKTSTELLKVLNRIWSLEEQHASNASLVKGLKKDLDLARIRIKELLLERQSECHEIDDMMKEYTEEKIVRQNKEHNRIKIAVQSVQNELEGERKMRKRSETLHRKLARELSKVRSDFSKASKDLEREKKTRMLLEDICDEFAKGIGEYEQKVQLSQHISSNGKSVTGGHDQLVLHASKVWLNERMQMKLAEARHDLADRETIVDRLSSNVETFLRAKKSCNSNANDILPPKDKKNDSCIRRQSLESIQLHGALSAPQDVDDDEDSVCSESRCFEINKNMIDKENNDRSVAYGAEAIEDHLDEATKANAKIKKLKSREKNKGHYPSNLHLHYKEQMAGASSYNDTHPSEMSMSQKSENCIPRTEGNHGRKSKKEGISVLRSNRTSGYKLKNRAMLLDDSKVLSDYDGTEDLSGHPTWRSEASPVQKWISSLTSPDLEMCGSSSKQTTNVKEGTLKAKLLEARLEGLQSRLKASKDSC